MAGRDTRRPDPDDWFAEPTRAPSRRGRHSQRTAANPRVEGDEDDSGYDDSYPRRQLPAFAASLPEGWVPLAVGAAIFVILIIAVLAVAGVFSGSSPTQAVTTNQSTSTPTTTPATTPSIPPSVPAPTTTLKPGDTGVQVKRLQRALAALGYSVGKVDGDYGTATKTALEAFQTAQNLTPDGLFGPATRTALIKALKSA
jgi:peptidoglycan hydrolase-like protein with peptidoglycan-binding domain